MQFFRAYYDSDGRIVYELRIIARNYFFSKNFVLDFIASFPMQLAIYYMDLEYGVDDEAKNILLLLAITQLLRLVRISRINLLTKSSIDIQTWWEKQNVAQAMLISFILKLVMMSHWIACFWSFLAFVSVWSFGRALGEAPNWISNWYGSSYVEGGINPIGWESDIDRYALSLFWTIQSLTSIGYGNVVAVTRVEYYFANILMLVSGMFWAFMIGNIISVVGHMNSHRDNYRKHLDEANMLIRCFTLTTDDTNNHADIEDANVVATRIRRFVSAQYDGPMTSRPSEYTSPTLDQVFPTLGGLSLELRHMATLHLVAKYIEMVPYLSHDYLTRKEQASLAFKCIYLEFSRGETYTKHPRYGRGVMVMKQGSCISLGLVGSRIIREARCLKTYSIDNPIAVNDTLVEDSFLGGNEPLYRFMSYSLVVFIPQSAIFEVLKDKKMAWKNCARWRYLRTCLVKWSRDRNDGVHMANCSGREA